jgi:hypothetical protein
MSLFNETVRRLAKAEEDLAEAQKRIASLEKALAASRRVNALAIHRGFANSPVQRGDLNTLSNSDVEKLFSNLETAKAESSRVRRLFAPFRKLLRHA